MKTIIYLLGLLSTITYTQALVAQDETLLTMDFMKFEGHKENQVIILEWEVNQHQGSKTFTIERADENGLFTKVGTTGAQESFVDYSPINGINYYRLVLVDDNHSVYSPTIAVEYKALPPLTLSPNPAREFVNINFYHDEESSTLIQILDQKGNIVRNESFQGDSDIYTKQVALIDLEAGVYLLRVIQQEQASTRKLVVLP